jgi:hypothetical protein
MQTKNNPAKISTQTKQKFFQSSLSNNYLFIFLQENNLSQKKVMK